MKRELITAYASSAARAGGWVVVSGVVFRRAGPDGAANLALLLLARGTVGLLSYTTLGLTPVLVHLLTRGDRPGPTSDGRRPVSAATAYATAGVLTAAGVVVGGLLLCGYAFGPAAATRTTVRAAAATVFFAVGLGTLLRAASDYFAAALQAGGKIATDNGCQIVAEATFVGTALFLPHSAATALPAAWAYAGASAVLLSIRGGLSLRLRRPSWAAVDRRAAGPILLLGSGIVLSQLADWMYAPLNQILIDRYLDPPRLAAYGTAIQVDGGLLLAVSGLANVLLPAAAIAHRDDRLADLRRWYVRATLAGFVALACGAAAVVAAGPWLFRAWFNDPMPLTRAILPWVLVHTVIGGTATVGRSVLLGMGEVRAYTLAALAGGLANAGLATLLVTQTSLGLRGVVLATIVTVTLRCGVWMPWYVLRRLRPAAGSSI